jgi:DNA-binding MarR family transcriptional regulator
MSNKLDTADVALALLGGVGVFVRRLRRHPIPGGLTAPEMSALSVLDRRGALPPSTIARAEQITPQAIGATMAALEQRGLVERTQDPADGRRVLMSLTEAGRLLVSDKHSARTQQIARLLDEGFTDDELRTLSAAAPLIERLGDRLL